MRIHLKLSKNTKNCPISYQHKLVGTLHKWIGANKVHDQLSLYSMSWLDNGKLNKEKELVFKDGASWFISSPNTDLVKSIIHGVQKDPNVAFGMYVQEIQIQENPQFEFKEYFKVATPILIKRTEGKSTTHYRFDDKLANQLMTETMHHKLRQAGYSAPENIEIKFDLSYIHAKQKLITYRKIKNKANVCPIIIKGDPQNIAFAWMVGIGNSTGIGFGSLY